MKYAIAFDLDTAKLKEHYHSTSPNNAYPLIRAVLEEHRFTPQQGSVYFGADGVNAVDTVMAIMDLTTKYPWFDKCVTDVRMLRVEEDNDLKAAVARAAQQATQSAAPIKATAPAKATGPASGPRPATKN